MTLHVGVSYSSCQYLDQSEPNPNPFPIFLLTLMHFHQGVYKNIVCFLQCSVTCGDGLQTRTVKCSEGLDKCDPKTKPDISANCNTGSCPQWSVGLWSQV